MTIRLIPNRVNSRTFAKLEILEESTRRGIGQGLFEVGQGLIKRANDTILRGVKSGRVYIIRSRSGRLRRHKSSAGGETHANITGATRKSLSFKHNGSTSLEFGYGVSGGPHEATDWAEFLEFGTSKMDARPRLTDALTKS